MNATIICLILMLFIAVLALMLFNQECYIKDLEEDLELREIQLRRLSSLHLDDPLWRRAHEDE